jgi:hypothetical protein
MVCSLAMDNRGKERLTAEEPEIRLTLSSDPMVASSIAGGMMAEIPASVAALPLSIEDGDLRLLWK